MLLIELLLSLLVSGLLGQVGTFLLLLLLDFLAFQVLLIAQILHLLLMLLVELRICVGRGGRCIGLRDGGRFGLFAGGVTVLLAAFTGVTGLFGLG